MVIGSLQTGQLEWPHLWWPIKFECTVRWQLPHISMLMCSRWPAISMYCKSVYKSCYLRSVRQQKCNYPWICQSGDSKVCWAISDFFFLVKTDLCAVYEISWSFFRWLKKAVPLLTLSFTIRFRPHRLHLIICSSIPIWSKDMILTEKPRTRAPHKVSTDIACTWLHTELFCEFAILKIWRS